MVRKSRAWEAGEGAGSHSAYTVLVLDDVLPDGGQRGPFAVIGCPHRTSFVSLELTHCKKSKQTHNNKKKNHKTSAVVKGRRLQDEIFKGVGGGAKGGRREASFKKRFRLQEQ